MVPVLFMHAYSLQSLFYFISSSHRKLCSARREVKLVGRLHSHGFVFSRHLMIALIRLMCLFRSISDFGGHLLVLPWFWYAHKKLFVLS